jgi:hypothetical protein
MMLRRFAAAAGFAGLTLVAGLYAGAPARAAAIVENFTINGTATQNITGNYGITSTTFADFNTSLGTLTGVTVSFAGLASFTGTGQGDYTVFVFVAAASDLSEGIISGSGMGTFGPFNIDANDTDTAASDLALFEGSGTQALVFDFLISSGTVTASDQSGTLTYDYTPVPESSSLSLFAAALPGLFFLGRHGFAAAVRSSRTEHSPA